MNEFNIKKFIFSSSSTVYGEPQFLPITEEHPTGQNCANPYGRTKFMVEEILKDLSVSDKVKFLEMKFLLFLIFIIQKIFS